MSKENKEFLIWAVIIVSVIGIIISGVLLSTNIAEAQDTAPAYEYAALIYEGDSAFVFTDELDVNSELNATLDSMGDDFNLIRSLNLMGERGWQFVDAQPAGAGVTLYLFERVE